MNLNDHDIQFSFIHLLDRRMIAAQVKTLFKLLARSDRLNYVNSIQNSFSFIKSNMCDVILSLSLSYIMPHVIVRKIIPSRQLETIVGYDEIMATHHIEIEICIIATISRIKVTAVYFLTTSIW